MLIFYKISVVAGMGGMDVRQRTEFLTSATQSIHRTGVTDAYGERIRGALKQKVNTRDYVRVPQAPTFLAAVNS